MKKEDYELLGNEIETLERAFKTKIFRDPDGSLINKISAFCKNNGIAFCRGCNASLMPTLHTIIQMLKSYQNAKQKN